MSWPLAILGTALCLVGAVWIGQGVGLVGGSFMTGQATWAVIGAIAFAAGLAVLRRAFRRRPV